MPRSDIEVAAWTVNRCPSCLLAGAVRNPFEATGVSRPGHRARLDHGGRL